MLCTNRANEKHFNCKVISNKSLVPNEPIKKHFKCKVISNKMHYVSTGFSMGLARQRFVFKNRNLIFTFFFLTISNCVDILKNNIMTGKSVKVINPS